MPYDLEEVSECVLTKTICDDDVEIDIESSNDDYNLGSSWDYDDWLLNDAKQVNCSIECFSLWVDFSKISLEDEYELLYILNTLCIVISLFQAKL